MSIMAIYLCPKCKMEDGDGRVRKIGFVKQLGELEKLSDVSYGALL